jgi:hypothetical protein
MAPARDARSLKGIIMLMDILLTLLGMLSALIVFMFLLPIIPSAIEMLSNKPNRYRGNFRSVDLYPVSEFGFFTALAPGQTKIIVAGEDFIRCIMHFKGHAFRGQIESAQDIQENAPEYWKVVSTTEGDFRGEKDTHPILLPCGVQLLNPFAWILYVWERWVFYLTGFVFTGLYPYRKVRTYVMSRFDNKFESKQDYSDHFRVMDFEFPVRVQEADTQDKFTVSISITEILRVFNPFLTAYGTDNWASRLIAATEDCITSFTRPRPLNDVLSAKSEASSKSDLVEEVKTIDKAVPQHDTSANYGIELRQVLVKDISPVETTSETKKRLAGAAFAAIERQTKEELAKGDAARIREQIKAVKEGDEIGLAVLASERDVRTAEAAGDNAIVVVGSGSRVDPIQSAILKGVRDLNKQPRKEKE